MASIVEDGLLTMVLNLSCQKGWVTENEKVQIETRRTFNDKKISMLELLNKMECDDNAARLLLSMRCIHDMNAPEYSEGDENRFLPKIMSKLFEKGLVTKEEMLECEEQIPEEKETKGHENSDLPKTNFDDCQRFVNERSAAEIINHSLNLGPVIRCILQYLNVEEIKTSRLISKEWASVALNVLIARSKIKLGFFKKAENQDRRPLTFFQVFSAQNEGNQTVPFRNFEICSRLNRHNPWTLEELNFFFRIQQQYITELKISDLYLVNDRRGPTYGFGSYLETGIETLDITSWISNSPMAIANSNTKTNTKLTVDVNEPFHATKLLIQSSAFSFVKDLKLSFCTVNLQDGILINPISLEIIYVMFTRDGNQSAELCVNEFVNFTKANSIHLSGSSSHDETRLSLDLKGCHELQCLNLTHITLGNFTTSRWKVEKLNLYRIQFIERTQMQIKELAVRYAQIDISVLPSSLEKLVIEYTDQESYASTQPTILHNLKYLTIDRLTTNNISTLFQNVQFPNVVRLSMEECGNREVKMDLAWLSTSKVKILKLIGITITNEENKNLNLDKLILHHYRPSEITKMCGSHIQTKQLFIDCPWEAIWDLGVTDVEFLNFLESQKSSQDCGQRIYVGGFNKIRLTKAESPLRPYVDSAEEYYVFENNLGKAIERSEIKNLLL